MTNIDWLWTQVVTDTILQSTAVEWPLLNVMQELGTENIKLPFLSFWRSSGVRWVGQRSWELIFSQPRASREAKLKVIIVRYRCVCSDYCSVVYHLNVITFPARSGAIDSIAYISKTAFRMPWTFSIRISAPNTTIYEIFIFGGTAPLSGTLAKRL